MISVFSGQLNFIEIQISRFGWDEYFFNYTVSGSEWISHVINLLTHGDK